MTELKPCPYCGYHAATIFRQRKVDAPKLFYVQCESTTCDVEGPLGDCALTAEEAWNNRHEEDRLRSALQAAERERDEAMEALSKAREYEPCTERGPACGSCPWCEVDTLRKQLLLHPTGKCTCAGEGRCAWCQKICIECLGGGLKNDHGNEVPCGACAGTGWALEQNLGALQQMEQQRDAARLEAGRLAEQVVELTGKLVLAEVEVGRLRERLRTTAQTLIAHIGAAGPEDAQSCAERAVLRLAAQEYQVARLQEALEEVESL